MRPVGFGDLGALAGGLKGGMALGFMDGIPFRTGYVQLNPGDSLLLYTDGVNEALNTEGRMFHVSGIERTLNGCINGASAEAIVTGLAAGLLAIYVLFSFSPRHEHTP